jgi:hypothetical protein
MTSTGTYLKPCPCCGRAQYNPEDPDVIHPSGSWATSEEGYRHYLPSGDPAAEGKCYVVNCVLHYGGCGLNVSGDSKEEAIAAWNRRPEDEWLKLNSYLARPEDFKVDTLPGAVGRFAPKTLAGIKVTHGPTGISVEASQHRSQHRNRQEAYDRLLLILRSLGLDLHSLVLSDNHSPTRSTP